MNYEDYNDNSIESVRSVLLAAFLSGIIFLVLDSIITGTAFCILNILKLHVNLGILFLKISALLALFFIFIAFLAIICIIHFHKDGY